MTVENHYKSILWFHVASLWTFTYPHHGEERSKLTARTDVSVFLYSVHNARENFDFNIILRIFD